MKPTLILLALTSTVASAWKLELSGGGRKVSMHGTKDSGCKNISFSPVLSVTKAKFSPKTDWYPDPTIFELNSGATCAGLSYRNDGGTYTMKARKIRSYKVK